MTLPPLASTDASLDRLASHCIAARAMIQETGTPLMQRLIDLLLFEIAVTLADPVDARREALETTE